MKERPILFSGPMVRAILGGSKTVTRRALNAQSLKLINYGAQVGECHYLPEDGKVHQNSAGYYADFCPYGLPGDRLWVRETYADAGCRLTYRADTDDGAHCKVKKWTPAIHMFRKDSRILLEITAVRVERLQDITEDQAIAEGIDTHPMGFYGNGCITAGGAFLELWESINGDGSWAANPWVWVIEFRRVTP
ncbi:hypothetical protein JEU36_30245 [Pseudomonas aeruginosa]|uniref:hypothetical protein n=1 Tax=Pseudomonas aeruginosa TaxID=287 RepID=UPI001A222E27|nr:hypothetical protein [Pseudomonas aeruginosa]MBI7277659.1 hypothetical protein [Pseudomonas aeruginosa]MCV0161013.1 hypothetical protein [Pseudomonas aeruginosa]